MDQALEVIVGVLVVPLVGWIKKQTGLEGKGAMWLSVVVSLVLGGAYHFAAGEFANLQPDSIFVIVPLVFGTAQIVYKQFFADK